MKNLLPNLKIKNKLKKLKNKIQTLLPHPHHPWRDPLKNTPFKWYELIDVSSGSEDEGDR